MADERNQIEAFNTERGQELQQRLLNQPNPAIGSEVLTVTSDGTANTEYSVAHGLGRVPTGYLVIGQDKAAVNYNGTTPNTDSLLYLRTDTVTVALKLLVW